jgi:uncharacterized protein (DUF1800 family)
MGFRVLGRVGISLSAALLFSACGGGGDSSIPGPTVVVPPAPPIVVAKPYTELATREEAARFLIQAGLGATDAQIDAAVGTDAAEWIARQMAMPATRTLAPMQASYATREDTDRHHSRMLWTNFLQADDVLRQRMYYALSQIFVVSDNAFFDEGFKSAHYTDILTDNAFGNYRQLLEDVTYSPAMGEYLTYYRNRKGDARTGRMPDENYAREVLQLFSIGLVELNPDGTPKPGAPETYDNEDIIGLARVFTGLSGEGPDFGYNNQVADWRNRRMKAYDSQHSTLEKSFLGTIVPENTGADASIGIALDTIANHPNVGPFLSRQLIQRFTASSPSPAYVARVNAAFESGVYEAPNGRRFGTGTRGDLAAALAAVLLDETVHDDVQAANEGKVREPVLKFIQYHRTFSTAPINVYEDWRFNDTRNPATRLAQHPLRSNSVFNFYRPGYLAPGSVTGDAGYTAPEMQIVTAGSSLGFANFMSLFILSTPDNPVDQSLFQPNWTTELSMADDPAALVDHLALKLTAGQLSAATRTDMIDVIGTLPLDPERDASTRQDRVQLALTMMFASGAYAVQN